LNKRKTTARGDKWLKTEKGTDGKDQSIKPNRIDVTEVTMQKHSKYRANCWQMDAQLYVKQFNNK
jgi:hypothetical protein